MSFSERNGYKKIKTEFQKESMDDDLKNSLWNCISNYFFNYFKDAVAYSNALGYDFKIRFIEDLAFNFFKITIEDLPTYKLDLIKSIKNWIYETDWFNVYDFIESIINFIKNYDYSISEILDNSSILKNLEYILNFILKRELSGYSLISGMITPIISDEEIKEIEKVLDFPLKGVNIHIQTALKHLSNKKNPDYRNSIKESISAVESLCQLISGDKNATLGQALKIVEKTLKINSALKSGFSNIYGYTSSDEGIRHALFDESTLDLEDAQFMLVSCSAFINYLIEKSNKSGIKF
ncbi:MAG: hypothetical protein PHN56_05460 [Candidatus Nanoarchaeia archaeon]|nr:hypothetical protein [Candidatus Nanoarchaeia archaeon]